MLGFVIAITLHLLGIILWIGGMAARLIFLSAAPSDVKEGMRSQIYQVQRSIHFLMEIPGFILTLLAGGFLIHAAQVNFHMSWFMVKTALVVGLIVIELLGARQIKAFNVSGRGGQAMGLLAGLVACTLLILVAVKTKF